jgi:hypothetical protein
VYQGYELIRIVDLRAFFPLKSERIVDNPIGIFVIALPKFDARADHMCKEGVGPLPKMEKWIEL